MPRYLIGWYRYADMPRAALAGVKLTSPSSTDALPPTMHASMAVLTAPSRKVAMTQYRSTHARPAR